MSTPVLGNRDLIRSDQIKLCDGGGYLGRSRSVQGTVGLVRGAIGELCDGAMVGSVRGAIGETVDDGVARSGSGWLGMSWAREKASREKKEREQARVLGVARWLGTVKRRADSEKERKQRLRE